jgi:hypothetical protein
LFAQGDALLKEGQVLAELPGQWAIVLLERQIRQARRSRSAPLRSDDFGPVAGTPVAVFAKSHLYETQSRMVLWILVKLFSDCCSFGQYPRSICGVFCRVHKSFRREGSAAEDFTAHGKYIGFSPSIHSLLMSTCENFARSMCRHEVVPD